MSESYGDLLTRLAGSNESTDSDGAALQRFLRRIDFPRAVVVCGVVYIEGKGTLEAPPASVHAMAQMLLGVAEAVA
jgi:hypothetical protein